MSAARATGAGVSVALHAAIVALAVIPIAQMSEQSGGIPVLANREGEEAEMRLLPNTDGEGAGLACERTYRGVGVTMGYTGRVGEVVPGGPADKAGLRVGDAWLNDGMFVRDSYAVGRELVLKIERDGQRIDLPVRIGRICYEMAGSIPHLAEHP